LVETVKEQSSSKSASGGRQKVIDQRNVISFSEVEKISPSKNRISTGIGEFDRVLGADRAGKGMVPGAVMLIGGEPGIGKSTLLTQLVVQLLSDIPAEDKKSATSGPILYIAGEESPSQIALRIKRILENEHLKLSPKKISSRLKFVTSTDVDEITTLIVAENPFLVIIDSIQTLTTEDLLGSSGSVGQLREATERITAVVKRNDIPTFLVGHVTKEGTIAGPKVLEHIVDAVLELSGERTGQLRLLRAIKNRFGATDEVGIFQVNEYGLAEVENPSEIFLEAHPEPAPGTATACVMEGTRPLLIEVQALVVESQLAMPRRVGRGVQLSRLQVLAAVLQKHGRLPLGMADIFLNVAGGFTITEPAIDLALCMAIISSHKNVPLPEKMVFIGEVGLLGEIRRVAYGDRRVKEAKRLGFSQVISYQTDSSVQALMKRLKLH